jgi:uncharacterized membrane protein
MTTSTPASPRMRRFIIAVDRFIIFVTRRWLALANAAIFLFAGLPFLPPVLMHYGLILPADLIYKVYSFTCHQLSYRTYFFFGEQTVYPIGDLQRILGVSNPASDIFYWREFIGNPQMGYKMAWCERDMAIYLAMLLTGILFSLLRSHLKPLNWRIYLLFITPMAIDGFTQLFGLRESDWILRTITGVLFGFASIWLVYPYVEEAMRDAFAQAKDQYQRARAREDEPQSAYGK